MTKAKKTIDLIKMQNNFFLLPKVYARTEHIQSQLKQGAYKQPQKLKRLIHPVGKFIAESLSLF